MSFPVVNAKAVGSLLTNGRALGASANKAELLSLSYPIFSVNGVVDVSGMEMAIATHLDSTTGNVQALASGTTTVVFKPHDGNTNGGGATDNNEFFAVTDFSNSATGAASWTVAHGAMRAIGTSTTDLDADDWVNIDVAVNTTGVGPGVAQVAAVYIYGKPAVLG